MTVLVTRCPECGTLFNASAEQLETAGGLVRCGVCLAVFDGRAHRDFTVPTHQPNADEGNTPESGSPVWPRPPSLGAAHPFTLKQAPTPFTSETEDVAAPEPDSETLPIDECSQPADPSPAEQEATAVDSEPLKTSVTSETVVEAEATSDILQTPVLADDIFDPPQPPPSSRSGLRVWSALTGLVLLLFASAYSWYNAADLVARFEPLRPHLSLFCELTRCQLPPRTDLSRLQVAGLVVRTHPQKPDWLLVEARLINRADFPQPLPALTLTFEDLQGQSVTRHTFYGQEYAPSAATSQPPMLDTQQQVAVRLEISDPGPEAVSYLLTPLVR